MRQIGSLSVQLVSKQWLIDCNRLELDTNRRLALDAQRILQVATAEVARVLKVAAHRERLVLIYKEEVAALETPSEQATRLAKRLSLAEELHEATTHNLKALFQELECARQQQAQVENQLRHLSHQAQFDHQLSQTRIAELRVTVSRLEAQLATERANRIQLEADLQDSLQLLAESQEREALARRLIAEQQKQIAAGDADLRRLKDSHRKLLSYHRRTAPPVPLSSPAMAAAAELRQLRAENRQLAVELDALQLYLQEKALHDGRIHVASSACDPPRPQPLPPALVIPAAGKRSVDDEVGASDELLQLKRNYTKHIKATMLGAAKRAKPNQ